MKTIVLDDQTFSVSLDDSVINAENLNLLSTEYTVPKAVYIYKKEKIENESQTKELTLLKIVILPCDLSKAKINLPLNDFSL